MLKGLLSGFANFVGKNLKIKVASSGYTEINGKRFYALKTAITANVTTTSAPVNSFGWTTHATGGNKMFYSDGTKWQIVPGS